MIPRRTPLTRTRIKRSDKTKERAGLIEECDALTKKLIIAERGEACERCGKTPVYSSHIKAKGHYYRIRFEKRNLILLCYYDHIHWWHKSPDEAVEWMEEQWPGRLQELRIMAATAAKPDLKMLVLCLRKEVSEL